jgi:hypothetical protein
VAHSWRFQFKKNKNIILISVVLHIHTRMANENSSTSGRHTCNLCGLTFQNQDEKEEHIKLEHSEHKQPSGVS